MISLVYTARHMVRCSTQLLIGIFVISAVQHIFLQHKIGQCHRSSNQPFYSDWFAVGWPYAVAYGLIEYGLPQLIIWLGFGPLGVLPGTIAARIQSIYGISGIFSILQSIGARGGVSNPVLDSIGLGPIFRSLKRWILGHDYVTECTNYYESWLTYLNIIDLAFVICFTLYWFFTHRG